MDKDKAFINDDDNINPFEDEKVKENSLNRVELMKLSGKELAKLAKPKSKLMYITLQKKSKSFLCDIILGIEKEDDKPKARATQNTSESDDILTFGINILESFKKARGEAELNPIAKEMFKQSAVSKVDEARADGSINSQKFNNVILALSATALVVDGVIGFKNVPGVFSKLKSKFKRNDTK